MAGVNKVILIGNLGKDPEIRHLEGGTAVANFSLATTETYTDRKTGEKMSQTEWHNIITWRKTAEFVGKYLSKGRQVYIEGKLKTRNWTDKEGVTKYTTEVVADTVQPLGARPNMEGDSTVKQLNDNVVLENRSANDDLPF